MDYVTAGFFRNVIKEIGEKYYPEVRIDDYHIDASTAHLIRHMQDFAVIITTNLFGDIISDLAGELTPDMGGKESTSSFAEKIVARIEKA